MDKIIVCSFGHATVKQWGGTRPPKLVLEIMTPSIVDDGVYQPAECARIVMTRAQADELAKALSS